MYDNPIITPPVTYPEPEDVEFKLAAARFYAVVGQKAVEMQLKRMLRQLLTTGACTFVLSPQEVSLAAS